MIELKTPGEVIIFAGPHGAGKDTLEAACTSSLPDATRHVRYTNRDQAPGEIDGQTYHFVSQEEFDKLIEEDFFFDYVRNPLAAAV